MVISDSLWATEQRRRASSRSLRMFTEKDVSTSCMCNKASRLWILVCKDFLKAAPALLEDFPFSRMNKESASVRISTPVKTSITFSKDATWNSSTSASVTSTSNAFKGRSISIPPKAPHSMNDSPTAPPDKEPKHARSQVRCMAQIWPMIPGTKLLKTTNFLQSTTAGRFPPMSPKAIPKSRAPPRSIICRKEASGCRIMA
mmetsp:Transcript_57415/g.101897  ORF Transcript_57415/g.101897 Transcript_57415/m.101897 type:complete len:201 (+) Transcript_57415:548-1150(+)